MEKQQAIKKKTTKTHEQMRREIAARARPDGTVNFIEFLKIVTGEDEQAIVDAYLPAPRNSQPCR